MDRDDEPPLDGEDPRFPAGAVPPRRPRRLERSRGPGRRIEDPLVGRLHVAVRVVFVAGLALVGAVFFIGLDPGRPVVVLGEESAVRAAVADAPRRVCADAGQPCAWLSVVEGRVQALSTSGPLREERGRRGVEWCPAVNAYVATNTGSLFDATGDVVAGPAPRGLDANRVVMADGEMRLDFSAARTGRLAPRGTPLEPPAARGCAASAAAASRDLDVPVVGASAGR